MMLFCLCLYTSHVPINNPGLLVQEVYVHDAVEDEQLQYLLDVEHQQLIDDVKILGSALPAGITSIHLPVNMARLIAETKLRHSPGLGMVHLHCAICSPLLVIYTTLGALVQLLACRGLPGLPGSRTAFLVSCH